MPIYSMKFIFMLVFNIEHTEENLIQFDICKIPLS